jgi:hypothetical protein
MMRRTMAIGMATTRWQICRAVSSIAVFFKQVHVNAKISSQSQSKGHIALFGPPGVNIHNAGSRFEGRLSVFERSEQGSMHPDPAIL